MRKILGTFQANKFYSSTVLLQYCTNVVQFGFSLLGKHVETPGAEGTSSMHEAKKRKKSENTTERDLQGKGVDWDEGSEAVSNNLDEMGHSPASHK